MKPLVTLEQVERRLRRLELPAVDAVVAIERGGRVPGELLATILERPIGFLRLAYRDDGNAVRYPQPRVLRRTAIPCAAGQRVLLVDDVSASGSTLRQSALELSDFAVTTLVLKGRADIVAFPELEECVTWPWTPAVDEAHAMPAMSGGD